VSTSASDHTRSLFNDRGGFTLRDISHGKNPSRKFYSQNLDQYDSFAKLGIRKQPQVFYQKTRSRRTHRTCPRSAISASPHFFLGRAHYRPFPRQQKKAPILS